MKDRGIFWALNRIHFHIYDYPRWEDDVVLQTWSRGQAGPLWHRNFRMLKGGQITVLGTSAWTVVDLKERSIYRGDLGFNPEFHYPEDTLPFCSKIIVPRELESVPAGSHTVLWSDLDTNGHANNCAYTQWVLDALPFEYIKCRMLRDVQVNYHREAHYGEQVDLFISRDADKWYITGKTGDLTCFVESLEFD
jgi:acyl-ACP thioesterase